MFITLLKVTLFHKINTYMVQSYNLITTGLELVFTKL